MVTGVQSLPGIAVIDPFIQGIFETDPRHLGSHATVWTAPLLRQYLHDRHHIQASRRSVGLAIARLGIAWKRPRYALARRAPTWRQAKGAQTGSRRASADGDTEAG